MFNLLHQESIIKVDCIIRKNTPYRAAESERRQRVQVRDFFTWIARKEDLIISKLDWAKDSHSETQLRDVRNLAASGSTTTTSSAGRGNSACLNCGKNANREAMNDTSSEIARMVHERMMALSGE